MVMRMQVRLMAALFAALAFCLVNPGFASARSLSFAPNQDGIVQFVTPSGTIGCTYIPFDGAGGIDTGVNGPELHCYRLYGKFEAVSLGPKNKALKLLVRGKLACCNTRNVLAFGNTWATNGFACTSERAGLICRRGKHGFSISAVAISRH